MAPRPAVEDAKLSTQYYRRSSATRHDIALAMTADFG